MHRPATTLCRTPLSVSSDIECSAMERYCIKGQELLGAVATAVVSARSNDPIAKQRATDALLRGAGESKQERDRRAFGVLR
jgi:hypothetical protein